MKTKFFLFVLGIIAFSICSCSEENSEPEASVDFDVSVFPIFNKTIYPSLIFGLSEIEKQIDEPVDYFTIAVNSSTTTDIKIVVQESKLNYETIITQKNVKGNTEIVPVLKWKYDELKNLSQPGNVDVTFVCYTENGNEIGRKDLRLSYRAVNECIYQLGTASTHFLFAAYVNEDSPIVDSFLKEVLIAYPDLGGFVGYQQGEIEVIKQVAAIFQTLRDKGVQYSSITETSNTNPNIGSQYVRFADEVLNNTQANCVDGTTFFCSVLKKIGIHTTLVFEPGHVYLKYYSNNNKTTSYLLETTLVGNATYSFIDASDINVNKYNSKLEQYTNGDFGDGYFEIDIDETRKIVKPIGR